nr:hypothetical protein [uncultured Methanospirillum sp.]
MCVGNACGGMSVTTIYPVAHSDPGMLMMGIGLGVAVLLITVLIKHSQVLHGRNIPCFAMNF